MKPIQPTHSSFRGKKFCIRWRKPRDKRLAGECENPKFKRPAIVISPELHGADKLRVMIDEAIHACVFDLDNDTVADMSRDIAVFLWRCGVRFKDEIISQAMEDHP